jgi:hypothetical protein
MSPGEHPLLNGIHTGHHPQSGQLCPFFQSSVQHNKKYQLTDVRLAVLVAVTMDITLLSDVMPHSLVERYRYFKAICYLIFNLKMDTPKRCYLSSKLHGMTSPSKKARNFNQNTKYGGVAVMPWIFIPKVLGFSLGWNTGYPD